MILIDLFPSIGDVLTTVMVNKVERGNAVLLFPAVLFACWLSRIRLRHRQRKWLKLSPAEQVKRQQTAYLTGRRNEMYPL